MKRDPHRPGSEYFDEEQVMQDNWTWLKDPVRDRWPRLGEHGVEQIDGDRERLLDQIQVAYGIHRDQAEQEVEAFVSDYQDYFELVRDRAPSTPIAPRPHH